MDHISGPLVTHRSIRRYRSDAIPQEHVDSIVHAATRASSSGNMQTYSIVMTRDADRRRSLWSMHFEQDMILQAPMLMTFCADWNRMNLWCRQSGATPSYDNFLSYIVGFSDAMIAAQNAALAAESLGYGICYMGTTLACAAELVEFFELPRDVIPATTLVVGVPDEDPDVRARLPVESIVHEETYQPFDEDRIKATYHARETEGWDRYMSMPEMAQIMRESGVENLAQVYTQLKYTRETNTRFSEKLLQTIRDQGFLGSDVP